jgi:hypothetical protein
VIRHYSRILCRHGQARLVEIRSTEGVWFEFQQQSGLRYRLELNELEIGKSLFKRRLEVLARRSVKKWLRPDEELPPLPPWPEYTPLDEQFAEVAMPRRRRRETVTEILGEGNQR